MSVVLHEPGAVEETEVRQERRGVVWRTLRRRPSAIVGIVLLSVIVLMALLAPWIAPYGLHEQVGPPFGPPSPAHPLGLDDGGIDMVTLLMWGTRISLVVGFAATVVSILIGGTVGLTAGYFGGKVDTVLMRITDYFIVIPDVPLMIVVAAIWGPSIGHIIIVIGILLWTGTARVLRAQVKSVRERVYVQRARALGASHWRIVGRHVLPQVAPLLIANTVLTVAVAIFDETALVVPRARRPERDLAGQGDRERVRAGRDLVGRLVGDRPAGHPRRADHPQLQPDRRRARGLPQPAPARRAPRRADVPAPAARGPFPGGAVTPLLQIEDLHVWFDIEDAPGAPRGAGRQHVPRGGRTARPRRRVGLREDDHRAGGPRAAPADGERVGQGAPGGKGSPRATARTASAHTAGWTSRSSSRAR